MRKLKMECSVTGRAFIRRGRTVKGQVKIFDTRRKFKELLMASQFSAVCQIISCMIQIIQPTRCNSFTSLLLEVYV
jgi:hypothetical protein